MLFCRTTASICAPISASSNAQSGVARRLRKSRARGKASPLPASVVIERVGLPPGSLVFGRAWAGVEAADAGLAEDAHAQRVLHAHLTREADVLGEPRLGREAVALGLLHLSGVAAQHLDAARRALRVPAAAVQDVNARVLDGEHELAPRPGLELLLPRRGLRCDLWHLRKAPVV